MFDMNTGNTFKREYSFLEGGKVNKWYSPANKSQTFRLFGK